MSTDPAATRMSGAEFAVRRHRLGLTLDELAEALNVNPRTVRAWESGRDPIPWRIPQELAEGLEAQHEAAVQVILDHISGVGPLPLPRDKRIQSKRPRGWYIAAAARALSIDPTLTMVWVGDDDEA